MSDKGQQGAQYPDPRILPLLVDLQGVCWWCGNEADSREHRHKRTDLRRMISHEGALDRHKEDERRRVIKSANNKTKAVRFGAVLCKRCNNEHSQEFDRAYDIFSDYLVANMDSFWSADHIDMEAIFGREWEEKATQLARYYCKNFGCAMADAGVSPPRALADFMNGSSRLSDVSLVVVSSESHYWAHKKISRLESGPNGSLWRPGESIWMNPRMTTLNGYLSMSLIGYVGVRFEWHDGWGDQDSFFGHPYPVLNRLRLSKRERWQLRTLDCRSLAHRTVSRVLGERS